MPVKKNGRESISVILTDKEYEQIKILAAKKDMSMSAVCRDFIQQGLNGTLSEQNLDFIVPIIREQLQSILNPSIERLASLTAKTCIQAGTATYLSAEAILKFVPAEQREEVQIAYEKARKKAVTYMQSKVESK